MDAGIEVKLIRGAPVYSVVVRNTDNSIAQSNGLPMIYGASSRFSAECILSQIRAEIHP